MHRAAAFLALAGPLVSAAVTPTAPSLGVSTSLTQYWAELTPYTSVENYTAPPDGCTITQVNLLQRHGARYPKQSDGEDMQASAEQLQSAKSFNGSQYDFLANWTYGLGTDDLVPFGAAQSYDSGQVAYTRYASLVNSSYLPFVRASGSQRVIDSANNWTAGFAFASSNQYQPVLSVIIDQSTNDTLEDDMCPNAESGKKERNDWKDVFAPAIEDRINDDCPGASIGKSDVINLMELCPSETVAYERASGFCGLFTDAEFAQWEYYNDLDDYYANAYGAALGPVQGVGWVNELLARLQDAPVQDATQTNATLDGDPATFPLGMSFYADFSHDHEMVSIFAALGLFEQSADLSTASVDADRTFVLSKIVPFSARLVAERLDCGGTPSIRVLVNDAVMPLAFCGSGDGLCQLDNFVESQSFARSNGNGTWAECSS
ncbi:phytase [Coniophora puteana RWD-64-598 SS2]|uniref:Phytase A n=1 Tax=Coniophora puteana (strain RWD-64-598) TaxID=741705 RepID=A0A5M3MCV7_CONPW|nr:phytase [Coniophora puteana RWD-64-598 SS2]EIW76471.1 phytase [Coniophora puteana RWD-64-598 SS2]